MVSVKGLPVPMLFETSKEEFYEAFLNEVSLLVIEGKPFSSDEVRKRLVTEPRHSNWYGVAMKKAISEFSLTEVAYGKSRIKSRNSGRRGEWIQRKERGE